MAIKLFLIFVMVVSVSSQGIRMPEFGNNQPLVDNSQGIVENSRSGEQSNAFQRSEHQGFKPVSSSSTAPKDITALVRSEIQTFMPLFVESAIKTILPKIESAVNRSVSGAISSLLKSTLSSLVQSAINSTGKSSSVHPLSSLLQSTMSSLIQSAVNSTGQSTGVDQISSLLESTISSLIQSTVNPGKKATSGDTDLTSRVDMSPVNSTGNSSLARPASDLLAHIQSAVSSALKSPSSSLDQTSTTQTDQVCSPACRPGWISSTTSFFAGAQITHSADPSCQFVTVFPECGANSPTPSCPGTDVCCPLECYTEIKACWPGAETKVCIPTTFDIGNLFGGIASALGVFG